MSKYLRVYTLAERWETFKSSDVHTIFPLITEIEKLSQETTPSKAQIENVRKMEQQYQEEIKELDKEDREVLEDMIVRILFQSLQKITDRPNRWKFTMERADDKGLSKEFAQLNEIIEQSEEQMIAFKSSGTSPEDYVKKQQEFLAELDELWKKTEKKIAKQTSPHYERFFAKQFKSKRGVIQRHIDHFQDNTFGEWMRALREQKEWSLARAAEETGVSSSYIHRIERGTRGVPSTKKLEQIAEGYGVPHSQMIMMASGEINDVDDFVENGAFQIKGNMATEKQKTAIAELIRMVVDGDVEESIEQIQLIQKLI